MSKTRYLLTGAAIIIALLSWWAWVNFSPKPLGDKMEYLGKKDYGNVFGFDSKPYSVYYYGTDMDEEEVASYFHGSLSHEGEPPESGYNGSFIAVHGKRGDFYVRLFENTNAVSEAKRSGFNLKNKRILTMTDTDYPTALESLK
ncbi:hypothetical protein PV379_04355 [Streptomyces caniscabiei]|uniref:hypothetical protein n=1 Tax=Streptomyces caniscabiei TaxID=2746961 RepID=UPI0029B13077|nr:hypothetical protein [Streptomyces caniscabiei]MDX2776569.1 hypothetical protein [Streptomyces caniscabiei]